MCENIPTSGEFSMQTFIHFKAHILQYVCPSLSSGFWSYPISWAKTKPWELCNKSCQLRGYRKSCYLWASFSWLWSIVASETVSITFGEIRITKGSHCEQKGQKRRDFFQAVLLQVVIWPAHRCSKPRALHLQKSSLCLWPNLNHSHPVWKQNWLEAGGRKEELNAYKSHFLFYLLSCL